MLSFAVDARRVRFSAPGKSASFLRSMIEGEEAAAKTTSVLAYVLCISHAAAVFVVALARRELANPNR